MRWSVYLVAFILTACVLPARAQQAASPNVYVFPLFLDGTTGGATYRSVLKITNTSTTNPMQCTLTQRNTSSPFVGVDGTSYSADVFDGGFSPPALTQITLDRFLPWEILRTNAQSSLKSGYAKLSCPGTVQTQLQFSLSDSQNNKIAEATVVPATAGRSFQFLVDRRDRTRLGFSFVNDSAAFSQYVLIARDRFNYEVDRFYDTIEASSQVSRFADELLSLPSDFVGSIEIVGLNAGQSYYGIGFQFTGTVFTTIQPLVRDTPVIN